MLQNLEAEQTLIGLAMTDPECAERFAQLPDDAFAGNDTRALQEIIRGIVKDHGVPNMVSVGTRIPTMSGRVLECSKKCLALSISPSQYGQIEREVLDLRRRRLLLTACEKVSGQAADPTVDVDQMAADLVAAANDNGNKPQAVGVSDVLVNWIEDLGNKDCMISTGIAGLDRVTGGLQNGMLAILGARPKVGKTALGLSIAVNIARKTGPVLIVSLEMTPKEILTRMVAAESGVDMQNIVTRKLGDSDMERMAEYYHEIAQLPIRFTNVQTPLRVRREAASMQRNGGLSLIMVDYIQLMKADESRKSRYEEVSAISRELKLMAMELNVPVLALTQFNRDSEQGGLRRKPSMSEARDSGSIEQDANLFLIQYPPNEPKEGSEMYTYWASCQRDGCEFQMLEIAANRQGPTGSVPIRFDKRHMRFTTMRRESD